jgi:hypothetical protein
MKPSRFALAALLLPFLVLGGCDNADPVTNPSISGSYAHSEVFDGATLRIQINITGSTSGGPFTFTGLSSCSGDCSDYPPEDFGQFTGSGTYTPPSGRISIEGGFQNKEFEISDSGAVITVYDSRDLNDIRFTLRRL